MTSLALPLSPSVSPPTSSFSSSSSPKAQEAALLLRELGFGQKKIELTEAQPVTGLRILLSSCKRCWG